MGSSGWIQFLILVWQTFCWRVIFLAPEPEFVTCILPVNSVLSDWWILSSSQSHLPLPRQLEHLNSRLDCRVWRVCDLVSGRPTRLAFLCWGDKEILTESYHRAWMMMDPGTSMDLCTQKSECFLGERCSELTGRGDSGKRSSFCTSSLSPKVSLRRTISWAHRPMRKNHVTSAGELAGMFAVTQWSEWNGDRTQVKAWWNQTPDPRLGFWSDHLRHLREHLSWMWSCTNPSKPAF